MAPEAPAPAEIPTGAGPVAPVVENEAEHPPEGPADLKAVAPVPEGAGQAPAAADPAAELDRLVRIWPSVLDSLRGLASGPTASYFEGTRPVTCADGRITIGFPPGSQFNRRNADKPERRGQLVEAVTTVTGEQYLLEYTELGSEADEAPEESPPEAVDEEQLVERVKTEFNAEEVI